MYGYIYLTTNLINNKKYIGQHKATKFSESYKGSGICITKAFKKYGKQNFSTVILEECDSLESLNAREQYWIKYYDAVASAEYYNILPGGQSTTEVDSRRRDNLVQKGDLTKGSIWIKKNGAPCKRIKPEELPFYESLGYERGGPTRGPLAKERYREAKEHLVTMTNGLKTIYIKDDEIGQYEALGFRLGRIPTLKKGIVSKWIYVTNSLEEHRILPEDLDQWIIKGYHPGRKKFKQFIRIKPAHNKGKKAVKLNDKISYQ